MPDLISLHVPDPIVTRPALNLHRQILPEAHPNRHRALHISFLRIQLSTDFHSSNHRYLNLEHQSQLRIILHSAAPKLLWYASPYRHCSNAFV